MGNLFGYFFNYINLVKTLSEQWKANFLYLGIIYFILSFLLMLVLSNSFKLKKNIYYPSSRWSDANKRNEEDNTNSQNSSLSSSNGSLFNINTLMEIKKKIEQQENKYNLYDLSLEEKLKTMSVSEFNYFLELKNMFTDKKYLFSIISLGIFSLIYTTILFWFYNYLINELLINVPNKMLLSYSIISFFGPLLGIFVNRAVEATTNVRKKEVNIFTMLINCISLYIISIFIQVKSLFE